MVKVLAVNGVFAQGEGDGPAVRNSKSLPINGGKAALGMGRVVFQRHPVRRADQAMKSGRQTTLGDSVAISGIGVHSGLPVTLTLHPADANTGIVFTRSDDDREILADYRAVTATELATVLGDGAGPLASTTEHVLAALRGLGVDNAVVELDGPEAPIMDGSAASFVTAIDQAGIETLAAPRRYLQVLKPVRVAKGESYGELRPHARGFRVEIEIEFDHPLIGRQSLATEVEPDSFRREVSRARTFGFMKDVSKLWSAGYALGATFENTLVVSDNRVLNPEGTRYPDEFVRHKALDAIGDLALAGAPILGTYRSVRGGHKLNHSVLVALMADPTAWALVEAEPARRRGHADVAAGLVARAYGPDVS
jgi:UDP-3-O-[3-hydroxymyristoyl] N-acetylglucosamine deacetylase